MIRLRFKPIHKPLVMKVIKAQEQPAPAQPAPAPLPRVPSSKESKYYRVHSDWEVRKYRGSWAFSVGYELEVLEKSGDQVLVNFHPTLTLLVAEEELKSHCSPL